MPMKIAVYAISKNEEAFVERWYESAKDADYLIMADTGSTDKTVEIARGLGITVTEIKVDPWRFDVARNMSLDLVPKDVDYCISLDLDEILVGDFRAELEKAKTQGVTRPHYTQINSFNEDGSPGLVFDGFKCHTRHGYAWKNPVHETPDANGITETHGKYDFAIHHHQNTETNRSTYLGLIKMAAEENPEDERSAFYYARELYIQGKPKEAAEEFRRHLSLKSTIWKPQKAASMCYLGRLDKENAIEWFIKALLESPGRREPLVLLAQHFYEGKDYESALFWSQAALLITVKKTDYFCEPWAWDATPYEYASLSSFYMNDLESAINFCAQGIKESTNTERLEYNFKYFTNLQK